MTFAKKHPTLDENQVIFDLFFKGLGPKFWEALEEKYFKNMLYIFYIEIRRCHLFGFFGGYLVYFFNHGGFEKLPYRFT